MKTFQLKNIFRTAFVLAAGSASISQPLHAQLFSFGTRMIDSTTTEIQKIDLSNGSRVHFFNASNTLFTYFPDSRQTWLFCVDYNSLYAVKISDTSQTRDIANDVSFAHLTADLPTVNKIVLDWISTDGSTISVKVFDATSLAQVDSLGEDASSGGITFPSTDGTLIYSQYGDANGNYLRAYSLSTKSLQWTRDLSQIGPSTDVKLIYSGKVGKALIGHNFPTAELADGRFLVYDPATGLTSPSCAFPYRAEATLSSNAGHIIAHRVEIDTSSLDGLNRTGFIKVFQVSSGMAERQLVLPPGGEVVCFDSDTSNFYYHILSTDNWIKVGLVPDPKVKGGIFNPSGNATLSVKAKPSETFMSAYTLIGLKATISWRSDPLLTLEAVSPPATRSTEESLPVKAGRDFSF